MSGSQFDPHPTYIPTLNGWRAIAIVLVLMGHGSDEIARAMALVGLRVHLPHELGAFGVQIFFALSGYLITTNLLEEEARRGRISLTSFFLRRVFRILPASFVFLLAVAALTTLGVLDVTGWRWFTTLFLLSNYTAAPGSWYLGHFWSLAIEEHFYIFWPFVFVLLGRNGKRLRFAVAAALIVAIWRGFAFKYNLTWTSSNVFWGRTDFQVDGILGGVAVAIVVRLERPSSLLGGFLSSPASLPILAIVIVALDRWADMGWKSMMTAIALRSAVLPLLILSTVRRPFSLSGWLLETRLLRWLGIVSYSLYLWQQLFLVWDVAAIPVLSPVQSFPLGIVAALLSAWGSFNFVERPMIRFGKRWREALVSRSAFAPPS